ncbi:MAG: glycosyltransferase family 2 protein [Myxococcota bacterium]
MRVWIDTLIIVFFICLNSYYALLLFLSVLEISRRKAERLPELDATVLSEHSTPPVTIIAPAFNEEKNIVESVQAFLQMEYPNFSIVVVNDGSTDDTLEKLREAFDLEPVDLIVRGDLETEPIEQTFQSTADARLVVIDKENGGKSDALNCGINAARTPLVCCVDADTLVKRDALLRMVEPYLYDPSGVVAVGGTVRLANGCTVESGLVTDINAPDDWLGRFQIIEYLRGFIFGRMGLNRLGGNLIISGAFGMFSRDALIEVGGYDTDTVGEDMELVVRLQRWARKQDRERRVVHIPEPIAFTEAPGTIRGLGRQRDRWHRGLAESLWRHKGMFFNPRYGWLGMFVFPAFLLFELLGPVIELFGYGWFIYWGVQGKLSPEYTIMFAIVAFVWAMLLSTQAVLIDNWSFNVFKGGRNRLKVVGAALLENFGYRQMTMVFRLWGLLKFPFGSSQWGSPERTGFSNDKSTEESTEKVTRGATVEDGDGEDADERKPEVKEGERVA